MNEDLDYAEIFEKILKDSGRKNVSPGRLSKLSREILIKMIGCEYMTGALSQEIGKTSEETSARLFKLKKSGYVDRKKMGWELTVLGEVLAKHLKKMEKRTKSDELVLR